MLFENMKCLPEEKDLMYHGTDVGNTFACKFSKNKNNVHMLACSTEHGEVIIQNTEKFYDAPFTDYRRSECKIIILRGLGISLCYISTQIIKFMCQKKKKK